jgi:DNA sulfur modification protein DndE
MIQTIKTAEANRTIVTELTDKLNIGAENVIARLAFAYSISIGQKLNLNDIKDSKGKEYSNKVLFGDYEPYYIAIVCQLYNLYKTDIDVPRYIKMHIDDGLNAINNICKENPNLPLIDFIFEQIKKGLVELNNR